MKKISNAILCLTTLATLAMTSCATDATTSLCTDEDQQQGCEDQFSWLRARTHDYAREVYPDDGSGSVEYSGVTCHMIGSREVCSVYIKIGPVHVAVTCVQDRNTNTNSCG